MFTENAMVGFVSLTPDYNTCCSEIYNGVTLTDCAIDGDREYPSTTMRSSDTMDKTSQKGDGIMSFVGMLLLEDRIIAFGDSKPTVKTPLGTLREDLERGKISKIFKQKEYVLATYNVNQFTRHPDAGEASVNIEGWLKENVPVKESYFDLLCGLSEAIKPSSMSPQNEIMFFIGAHDKTGLYVQNVSIQPGRALFGIRIRKTALYTGGCEYYTSKTNEIHNDISRQNALRDPERLVKPIIEEYISHADRIDSYNPAGCPVNVIEWRPESM